MTEAAIPDDQEFDVEFVPWVDGEPLSELEFERQITHDIAGFYDDFNAFVMYAFPWSEKGTELEEHDGPDKWQKQQQDRVSE